MFNMVTEEKVNVTIPAPQLLKTGVILDNDSAPAITVNDINIAEGNSGVVTVTLSNPTT